MKNGIPLCIALCTVLCRPAAAAPGQNLPTVQLAPSLTSLTDNGVQGITLNLAFTLTPPPPGWQPPASVNFSIDTSAPPHTGTFTTNAPSNVFSIPVTYSRLASLSNFTLSFSNAVNMNGTPAIQFMPNGFTKRTLTVTGGTANEGNAGTAQVSFNVGIDKAIAEPITFTYVSNGGTATAGQDYTPVVGTGTIPAGWYLTIIQIAVKGDTGAEPDETLGLEISDINVPVLRGTDTTAVIQNDDAVDTQAPAPAPALVTEASVAGDTAKAWFSVTLPQARAVPVVCRVSTRDGSAKAGSDYRTLTPADITFAAGETQKWVSITVTATPEVESREEFFLDVEEVQSHTVKSAACNIERFAVTRIAPDQAEQGVYLLTFPAGLGQRYVIEESSTLSGTWGAASSLLSGAGALLEQKVYPSAQRAFFRVRPFSPLAPGTAAAGS